MSEDKQVEFMRWVIDGVPDGGDPIITMCMVLWYIEGLVRHDILW